MASFPYASLDALVTPYLELLAKKQVEPTGFVRTEAPGDLWPTEQPYWELRETAYGSFDPLSQKCPDLQDSERHKEIIREAALGNLVTEEKARRWISYAPETQKLVAVSTGRLAILTAHTHIRTSQYNTVSSERDSISRAVDQTAIENGYDLSSAVRDVMTDLEQYGIFALDVLHDNELA